ncbi:hypothetical protein RLDS_24455 [Sphingobium lactosutens DS20]|uniref:Uncharacterized protein n=1 Tax=Sphingobium lactosutens DS20 TaxID=1331060 RepID=T0HDH4_9SPHN|nr:hypothetical protein RLDS_24455 [Sphingobium lactosutens DS20]
MISEIILMEAGHDPGLCDSFWIDIGSAWDE